MALDSNRLKAKIKEAFEAEQSEQNDHNSALDRIADKLAQAIVEEIKQLKINYNNGLLAPNGAVTGTINASIS